MKVSACCNAGWDDDIGICHECKEHSEGINLDFTISDYLDAVGSIMIKFPNSRYGQVLFNVLHDNCPDIANMVRGTEFDPFYATYAKDERVVKFFEFIQRELPQ